jgi:hypothetical protein
MGRALLEERWLSPEELAEITGHSINTLARWRCMGKAPAFLKLSHRNAYAASDVEEWLRSRRVERRPSQVEIYAPESEERILALSVQSAREALHSGTTGFEATAKNRRVAEKFEATERARMVATAATAVPPERVDFATAAGKFIAHCEDVRYRSKPASAQRIKVSFTALVTFLGDFPLGDIDAGLIEAFKESRIVDCGVRDITIRHDLHALSLSSFSTPKEKLGSKEIQCGR